MKLSEYNDIDLTIISDNDKWLDHTEWNYKRPDLKVIYASDVVDTLNKTDFDVYIFTGFLNRKIISYCLKNRKKYVYLSDAVKENKNDKFYFIKHIVKKYVISKSNSVCVPGLLSRKYHEMMTNDKEKIFEGIYTFDNNNIFEKIKIANSDKKGLKRKYLIDDKFTFLFVGKLIKSRKIDILLTAYERIADKCNLIIIGDGEDEDSVREAAGRNRGICYLERMAFEELHKFYAIADAYVHPGEEPYSLAVIEAAIAGIPIVATQEVGAAYDVIKDGQNGYIVPLGADEKLEEAMKKIVDNCGTMLAECKAMQEWYIKNRSIDWAAEQLYQAIIYKKQ